MYVKYIKTCIFKISSFLDHYIFDRFTLGKGLDCVYLIMIVTSSQINAQLADEMLCNVAQLSINILHLMCILTLRWTNIFCLKSNQYTGDK